MLEFHDSLDALVIVASILYSVIVPLNLQMAYLMKYLSIKMEFLLIDSAGGMTFNYKLQLVVNQYLFRWPTLNFFFLCCIK